MDISEEQEIIEKIAKNPKAFGVLFDAYYPIIYRYILKRTVDSAVAQDISSETFLKSMKNIHKFRWQGTSILHWFYKIASNELRMYFRKNKYQSESLENLRESVGFDPKSDTDIMAELIASQDIIEKQKDFLTAHKILISLPLKYQEVITLRFIEDKKISEISFIVGKKEGTVKSLLSRGLVKLRLELEKQKMQLESTDGIELVKVDETVMKDKTIIL